MNLLASPEETLAEYARTRDPELIDRCLRDHVDQAYTQARRMLGNGDLAEDAVQEACLRLVSSAHRYRTEIPFKAWFAMLVSAAAIDQMRRRSSRRRLVETAAHLPKPASNEGEREDERMEKIRAALAAMPESLRTPLTLHYIAGMDREGIASALGIRPTAVAVRLSRGVQRLRDDLTRAGAAASAVVLVEIFGGLPAHAAPASLTQALPQLIATSSLKQAGSALLWTKVAALTLSLGAMVTAATVWAVRYAKTSSTSALSAATSLIKTAPDNTWIAAPNSHPRQVMPKKGEFPGTWGVLGPQAVIDAYGGAALDIKRNRLVLWGGGHTNYSGNELYAFDIPTLRWQRLTDPTPNPVADQEVNADGTPNSRQTYGGVAYLAGADRFFGKGGSLAGIGHAECIRTWLFDFDSKRWTQRSSPTAPGNFLGACSAYDAQTRKLWYAGDGLWSYDYDSDVWTKHNSENFYRLSCAIDSKRGRLCFVGNKKVISYDVRHGNFVRETWATSGADAFVAQLGVGLDYDPQADRLVGWSSGLVFALDPETRVWTTHQPSGATAPSGTANGIFGRWRYVSDLQAFILVTGADQDVYFYKLPR